MLIDDIVVVPHQTTMQTTRCELTNNIYPCGMPASHLASEDLTWSFLRQEPASAHMHRGRGPPHPSSWKPALPCRRPRALVALYFFGCPESSVLTTLAKEDISAIDLNTPLHTRETPSHVRVQPPEAASARSAGSEQG